MKQLSARGFTLIEIMVVVAIIGILSAVLYVNFGDARDSSRNKALTSELKELQLSLELYKAQNGRYPDVPACGTSPALADYSQAESVDVNCAISGYIDGLVPSFISELPTSADSPNGACNIIYRVEENNQSWYKLAAVNCLGGVDATTGITYASDFARCLASCGATGFCDPAQSAFFASPAIYSFGGECE